jgi:hypothetical protein
MQTGSEQFRRATLTLRIPADRFDEATAGVRPLGKVEQLDVSVEDVTEQYMDLEARLANARRLEERLLQLLETRTGTLEQVLAAERELARVRTEIELYDGRLRQLASRVSLSTLTIVVQEPRPILGTRPARASWATPSDRRGATSSGRWPGSSAPPAPSPDPDSPGRAGPARRPLAPAAPSTGPDRLHRPNPRR